MKWQKVRVVVGGGAAPRVIEVCEPRDVDTLLVAVRGALRDAMEANASGCPGFTVAIHRVESCEHEEGGR